MVNPGICLKTEDIRRVISCLHLIRHKQGHHCVSLGCGTCKQVYKNMAKKGETILNVGKTFYP